MNTPNIDNLISEVTALRRDAEFLRTQNVLLTADLTAVKASSEDAWKRVERLRSELAQKQESWYKAANYRDEVLLLKKQLETERMRLAAVSAVALADTEASRVEARKIHPDYRSAALSDTERRVDECIELRKENKELEKRINERYSDANYHMNALERLATFVKPKDRSSEGVVTAAIDWINRLLEAHTSLTEQRDKLREENKELKRWKDEALLIDQQIMSIDAYVRNHDEATIGDSVWFLVGKWLLERDYLKRKLAEIKNLLP